MKFRDTFLNDDEEGGRKAADELLIQVQHYLKELGLDVHGTDVLVRAYANLRGLGQACVKHGTMKATADICLFANGFTRRQPLFDFVDVGLGKERADHKVRGTQLHENLHMRKLILSVETFNFFVSQLQCRHVILGVCHDSGYVPFLERYAADESIRDRVTLLEGYQVGMGIRELGFKRIVSFTSVFASRPGSNSQIIRDQPKTTSNTIQAIKGSYTCAAVDPRRLGPVLKNEQGLRMDKPLSAEPDLVKAMRKKRVCYWLFLRGHCDGCNRDHGHPPLNVNEQHALWFSARQSTCYAHAKIATAIRVPSMVDVSDRAFVVAQSLLETIRSTSDTPPLSTEQDHPATEKATMKSYESQPSMQCSHKGNPDFYGLGIRVGLYLQLTTAILAKYLRPSAVPENLAANAIFLLALFIAVAAATLVSELRPEEIIVLLQLCFGFLFSVLSLLGSQVSFDRLWLLNNGTVHPSMASFARLTLTMAICVYAGWFWYRGRTSLNLSECPANIFFITKLSIYGGIGTFFQVQSTLTLIAVGGFFAWQSVELFQSLIALVCSRAARNARGIVSLWSPEDEHDEKTISSSFSRGLLKKLVTSYHVFSRLRHFARSNIFETLPRKFCWTESIDLNAIRSPLNPVDMESNNIMNTSDKFLSLSGSLSAWQQMLA
ncbi:MAG: hypothetical protein Q9207_004703 [Kuettlingeria erythrocarpa]